MKNLILILLLGLFTMNAAELLAHSIVQKEDLQELFSPDEKLHQLDENIIFWMEKSYEHPKQSSYLLKLSAAYSQKFKLTGAISLLKKSEDLLKKALQMPLLKRSNTLRTLAHNYITQHRFCEALDIVLEASQTKENQFSNDKILFDINMELGEMEMARMYLVNITNFNNFDFLIRKAKWEDHRGNLELAIKYLESAKEKADASKNSQLQSWVYSNLAEFYGHHGEIETAYLHFLKTLKLDPANWYALKGIAWIAYAHDGDLELAKSLLKQVETVNESADIHLILAEIASFEKKQDVENECVMSFILLNENNDYGDMNNKYAFLVAAEKKQNFERAYRIASREIANRPTVQSYDLLVWAYYLDGKKEKAIQLANTHLINQTYEPDILYHLAFIYQNNATIFNQLMIELEAASFELGPLKMEKLLAI